MSETLQWIAIAIILILVAWLNFFQPKKSNSQDGCCGCAVAESCRKKKAKQKNSEKTCTEKK